MPAGTVVFEDVNPEMLKGQVLKPLERGANVASVNAEPLSGRLRYRGRDRSEVEIPFGDKDQKGEYTLKYGPYPIINQLATLSWKIVNNLLFLVKKGNILLFLVMKVNILLFFGKKKVNILLLLVKK